MGEIEREESGAQRRSERHAGEHRSPDENRFRLPSVEFSGPLAEVLEDARVLHEGGDLFGCKSNLKGPHAHGNEGCQEGYGGKTGEDEVWADHW